MPVPSSIIHYPYLQPRNPLPPTKRQGEKRNPSLQHRPSSQPRRHSMPSLWAKLHAAVVTALRSKIAPQAP
ncbi:hypothetical protein BKA80DRAFT_277586 [Phyllosticta citrichinensis]